MAQLPRVCLSEDEMLERAEALWQEMLVGSARCAAHAPHTFQPNCVRRRTSPRAPPRAARWRRPLAPTPRPLRAHQAKGLQPLDTHYMHMARLAAIQVGAGAC